MEPGQQQAVRSDKKGWGCDLRGALRSTHIMKREQGSSEFGLVELCEWPRSKAVELCGRSSELAETHVQMLARDSQVRYQGGISDSGRRVGGTTILLLSEHRRTSNNVCRMGKCNDADSRNGVAE
jgi:hypothetical protein